MSQERSCKRTDSGEFHAIHVDVVIHYNFQILVSGCHIFCQPLQLQRGCHMQDAICRFYEMLVKSTANGTVEVSIDEGMRRNNTSLVRVTVGSFLADRCAVATHIALHEYLLAGGKGNGVGILSDGLIECNSGLVPVQEVTETSAGNILHREVMVNTLTGTFRAADIKHVDDGACDASHLHVTIETCYQPQVDDVFLKVLVIVAVIACNNAGIAFSRCTGNGTCIDDVADTPGRCITCLTTHQGCHIGTAFCCNVSFVDYILQCDYSLITLAAACYGTYLVMACKRTALVYNQITDTCVAVRVATQVAEKSLYIFRWTVDDQIQYPVSLTVEGTAPAQVNILCYGSMVYACHVDVVHQTC